jgi:NAD(P)-dependent dehydrogenase (short-subunit alcohol dehydrogenase family)
LAERGFEVYGTTRAADAHFADAAAIKVVQLDVRDDESVRRGLHGVLNQTGRLDVLVNAAGVMFLGAIEETRLAEARGVFETNFFGVLRLCQAVLPIMRAQRYGRIVNISSVLGFLPAPYMGVYAASKHAVEGYSESLDHEVRQFGIRVCVVEPGFTRTRLADNSQQAEQRLPEYGRERDRVEVAVRGATAMGNEPLTVASAVLRAATSPHPRLRYPAGHEATRLRLLRRFAPSGLLDRGLRKQFGLNPAVVNR